MRILFSYPNKLKNEVDLINQIVSSEEWDLFHLRKPEWSKEEINSLYDRLNEEVKKKTVFHKNFIGSCHSFKEVEELDMRIDYCFLSPIYDSISKAGYCSKFDEAELRQFLKQERKLKVIALGGVSEANYGKLLEWGFDGVAFLGAIWNKYE